MLDRDKSENDTLEILAIFKCEKVFIRKNTSHRLSILVKFSENYPLWSWDSHLTAVK